MEWLALMLGIAANLMTKLAERNDNGKPVTPWAHVRTHPYSAALGVIGPLLGGIILQDSGQLTVLAAAGLGYAGSSVMDSIAKAGKNRMAA
jgi:hypothetical protein